MVLVIGATRVMCVWCWPREVLYRYSGVLSILSYRNRRLLSSRVLPRSARTAVSLPVVPGSSTNGIFLLVFAYGFGI